MKKALLTLTFSLLYILSSYAQTTVPAIISTDQVWDMSGSPYLINQNTYVDTGVTITVMPGVTIESSVGYNLQIHGEFRAIGTSDSMITISTVALYFQENSKPHNFTTGAGSYLKYCNIIGFFSTSLSKGSIYARNSLKIEYCNLTELKDGINVDATFLNTYRIDILNCNFDGSNYIYGYLIRTRKNIIFNIHNSIFQNSGNLFIDGTVNFTNNIVRNLNSVTSYFYDTTNITCNLFRNIDYGINMRIDGVKKLNFNYNTLDSMGYLSFNPMLLIYSAKQNNFTANNNNFMRYTGTAEKIDLTLNNSNPSTSDTIDFKDNYWGSSDSTTIESYISDYKDNINLRGKANIANFKSSAINSCSYNTQCGEADFDFEVHDSIVEFSDKSTGTAYTVRWTFGDGNESNAKLTTFAHSYLDTGDYTVCLYIYNDFGFLCDSICKTISVGNSLELCEAKYYIAIDTTIEKTIFIIDDSYLINPDTKYNWNFGDGNSTNTKYPVHYYATIGKYNLCLLIQDSSSKCYSTYCDDINVLQNGVTLKVMSSEDITNIKNNLSIGKLSVFPNPSTGAFNIRFNSYVSAEAQISVINHLGQIVYISAISSLEGLVLANIDLSGQANGIYYLQVKLGDSTQKMILILNQ